MKCPYCRGKGGKEVKDFGDNSGNTTWDVCPKCNGKGTLTDK